MESGYPSFRELHAKLPPPDFEGMRAKVIAAVDRVKHLEYLGSGRGRLAYATESIVFKIPYTINAEVFNRDEARSYKHDPSYKARCRLIKLCGLDVVAMERLRPARALDWKVRRDLEEITCDDQQCGADKHGNLKVYDYEGLQLGAGTPVIDVLEVTGFDRHESPESSNAFRSK